MSMRDQSCVDADHAQAMQESAGANGRSRQRLPDAYYKPFANGPGNLRR
jgi:hypothetical protein